MNATIRDVLDGKARWCVAEGDALSLLREVSTASVDALIVDAPYSSGGFTRGDRTQDAKSKYSKGQLQDFGGDSRDQLGFQHWCAIWYGDALRATKPGGHVVTFTDWRQLPATVNSVQAGGWIWRGLVPWTKKNYRPQMGRFASGAEFMVWGTNGASLDLEVIGCLPGFIHAGSPTTDERVHLTQKPVEVMNLSVSIVPVGGIVLDPFCGSATTGVAALRRGCRFIGFERDAHYAQVARDRMLAEEQTSTVQARRAGQTALFAEESTSKPARACRPGDLCGLADCAACKQEHINEGGTP